MGCNDQFCIYVNEKVYVKKRYNSTVFSNTGMNVFEIKRKSEKKTRNYSIK